MRAPALFLLAAGLGWTQTNCPVETISSSANVEGGLAASDCRLRDVLLFSRSEAFADQYRVTLAEAGVLTVRMKSSEVNPTVYVLGETKLQVASNDDADGETNSRVTVHLRAGTYFILATSRVAGSGAYTLGTSFEAPRSCAMGDLAAGSTVTGELSGADCRMLDYSLMSSDERAVDRYRLSVAKRGVLIVDYTSGEYRPVVRLVDSRNRTLVQTRPSANELKVTVSLEAGTYTLWALAGAVATGGYTLKTSHEDLRACPMKNIEAGQTLEGELSENGCRFLDIFVPSTDEYYVGQFRLKTNRRAVYTLDMKSTALDPYLLLTDAEFEPIGENDDAARNVADAQIVAGLASGEEYLLFATAARNKPGAFTLGVAVSDPRSCPPKEVGLPGSADGNLTAGSCRILDLIVPTTDDTLAEPHKVVLAEKGVLTADLASKDFDTVLLLADENFESINENDDASRETTDSQLDVLLPPGAYMLLASTWDKPGAYTLKTKFREPRACALGELALGAAVEGALNKEDCTLRDILYGFTEAPPVDQYKLTLTERSAVRVRARSADFPPILLILEISQRPRGLDLNLAGGQTAEATATLNAGEYLVLVSTLSTLSGAYSVEAVRGSAGSATIGSHEALVPAAGGAGAGDGRPTVHRKDSLLKPREGGRNPHHRRHE